MAMTIYSACTKAIIDEGDGAPITEVMKYDPHIQEIMFNHCITCHSGVAATAGIDLESFDNVRFYTESGNLLTRIEDAADPMPPSGLLPPEDRQRIAKWVTDGYLEN